MAASLNTRQQAAITSQDQHAEKTEDELEDLFQRILDLKLESIVSSLEQEPSEPLECATCTNNAGEGGAEYCTNTWQNTEICDPGVTQCYLQVKNRVDLQTREIHTLKVDRGCVPADVTCDEAKLLPNLNDGYLYERYTQCCSGNDCNIGDVVSFPDN